MEIKYTTHFRERQEERDDWIFNTQSLEDSLTQDDKLSWKLKNKGIWYREEKEEEKVTSMYYYCILGNLAVYCGRINSKGDMIIATTYPFKKKSVADLCLWKDGIFQKSK